MKCKNCINLFDVVHEYDNHNGKWCKEKWYSPNIEIDRECDSFKHITNGDKIRCMVDEELVKFIENATGSYTPCGFCSPIIKEDEYCNLACDDGILRWLKEKIN